MTLRELLQDVPGARVVPPMSSREDELGAFAATQESTAEDAATVDGGAFEVLDVPETGRSGFTHFLDGAQRSWLAAYSGMSPIYLSHTSAGLLERVDRQILPPAEGYYSGEVEAFVPQNTDLAARFAQKWPVQSVTVEDGMTGLAIQQQCRNEISERRDFREQALAVAFADGCLLIDGGIGKVVAGVGKPQPLIVGMVKSHQKQYFKSRERVEKILAMKVAQRTSVFWRRGARATEADVYSFYLKLRDKRDVGPLFGLVRIELPARPEFIDLVSEVAGWILHERTPLSLPDPRFDRLLYPIRLVEQHLKARQPSDAAIIAQVGI